MIGQVSTNNCLDEYVASTLKSENWIRSGDIQDKEREHRKSKIDFEEQGNIAINP